MSKNTGTVVADAIVPLGSNPTHYDVYGQGGLVTVATQDKMYDIPYGDQLDADGLSTGNRKVGMIVWVEDEQKYYSLTIPGYTGMNTAARYAAIISEECWKEFSSGGSGGGFTTYNPTTYDDLKTLKLNNNLVAGATYIFPNIGRPYANAYGYKGTIIVNAVTSNDISPKAVLIDNVPDYINIPSFNGLNTVDEVIYYNKTWVLNTNGVRSNIPNVNSVDWIIKQGLDIDSCGNSIEQVFDILYDFDTDSVLQRSDTKGNIVNETADFISDNYEYSGMYMMQWGNPNWTGNNFSSCYTDFTGNIGLSNVTMKNDSYLSIKQVNTNDSTHVNILSNSLISDSCTLIITAKSISYNAIKVINSGYFETVTVISNLNNVTVSGGSITLTSDEIPPRFRSSYIINSIFNNCLMILDMNNQLYAGQIKNATFERLQNPNNNMYTLTANSAFSELQNVYLSDVFSTAKGSLYQLQSNPNYVNTEYIFKGYSSDYSAYRNNGNGTDSRIIKFNLTDTILPKTFYITSGDELSLVITPIANVFQGCIIAPPNITPSFRLSTRDKILCTVEEVNGVRVVSILEKYTNAVVTSGSGGTSDVNKAYVDFADTSLSNRIDNLATADTTLQTQFNLLSTNRANLVHPNQTRTYYSNHTAATAASVAGDILIIPNSIVDLTASGNDAQIYLKAGISVQTEGFDIGSPTTQGDAITLVGGTGKIIGKNSKVYSNSNGSWGIGSYGSDDPNKVYEIYDLHFINTGGNACFFDSGKEIHFYNCHFNSSFGVIAGLRRTVHIYFHDCILDVSDISKAVFIGHDNAKITFENSLIKVSNRTNTDYLMSNNINTGNLHLISTTIIAESLTTNAIKVKNLVIEGSSVIYGTVEATNLIDKRVLSTTTGGTPYVFYKNTFYENIPRGSFHNVTMSTPIKDSKPANTVGGFNSSVVNHYTFPITGLYEILITPRILDSNAGGPPPNCSWGAGFAPTGENDAVDFNWRETLNKRNGDNIVIKRFFNAGESARLYFYQDDTDTSSFSCGGSISVQLVGVE